MEDDGIEDLHFYFVEFNQHKRLIMDLQRNRSLSGGGLNSSGQGARNQEVRSSDKARAMALSKTSSVQQKTIESCEGEEELF